MLQHAPLAYPSLENLSHVLRHHETWPQGFEWDFAKTECCALGLAERLWADQLGSVAAMFAALSYWEYVNIFLRSGTKPRQKFLRFFTRECFLEEVTPGMVADQIDAYLAKRPVYA